MWSVPGTSGKNLQKIDGDKYNTTQATIIKNFLKQLLVQ